MRLIKSSSLVLVVLSTSINAFADDYQEAYNLCFSKNIDLFIPSVPTPQQYRPLSPEEQAKLCIPWLKQNDPSLASKIDLNLWKQGILREKYKR